MSLIANNACNFCTNLSGRLWLCLSPGIEMSISKSRTVFWRTRRRYLLHFYYGTKCIIWGGEAQTKWLRTPSRSAPRFKLHNNCTHCNIHAWFYAIIRTSSTPPTNTQHKNFNSLTPNLSLNQLVRKEDSFIVPPQQEGCTLVFMEWWGRWSIKIVPNNAIKSKS